MKAQHLQALDHGNWIRLERFALRQLGKGGLLDFESCVIEPPECLHTLTARGLLEFLPKIRDDRARKLLRWAGVGEQRLVGELTPREKGAIIAAVRERDRRRREHG